MSTIPVLNLTPTPLPASGNAANLQQDITALLPIIFAAKNSTQSTVAAVAASGGDAFHQALAGTLAVEQSVVPYIPDGSIQAWGGIGALVLSFLYGIIPSHMTAPTAALTPSAPAALTPNAPAALTPSAPAALTPSAAAAAPKENIFDKTVDLFKLHGSTK